MTWMTQFNLVLKVYKRLFHRQCSRDGRTQKLSKIYLLSRKNFCPPEFGLTSLLSHSSKTSTCSLNLLSSSLVTRWTDLVPRQTQDWAFNQGRPRACNAPVLPLGLSWFKSSAFLDVHLTSGRPRDFSAFSSQPSSQVPVVPMWVPSHIVQHLTSIYLALFSIPTRLWAPW